jgi:Ca2+-binding RTX toxin-like protein
MRVLPGIAVAVLVFSGAPATEQAAHGAAASCAGRDATIVGSGSYVAGTDGEDVIVVADANVPAVNIEAKSGDDLVCVTGGATTYIVNVIGGAGADSLILRTGAKADTITVQETEDLDIQTGGGLDEVALYSPSGVGKIHAGPGGGLLKPYGDKNVRVDLEDELLSFNGNAGRYTVKRFSKVSAHATKVTVFGDRQNDKIFVVACRAKLSGGAGNDFMQARNDSSYECASPGATYYGLKGNDTMKGTQSDDVLIGGHGRDKAYGGQGDDRCQAELQRSC